MYLMSKFGFCSGQHKCDICKIIYECEGVPYGHTGSKGYRCQGLFNQFCPDHEVDEYIKWHKEHGDLE